MADAAPRSLLLVLDGVGLAPDGPGNAVTANAMPCMFDLIERYGCAALEASGEAVGLPAGTAGNSEVGHLTLGSGVRVPSVLENVTNAYGDGSWRDSSVWQAVSGEGVLHVVGLLSDAGVHGHWSNLARAAELARANGVPQVRIHAIFDGVDAQAGSAPQTLEELQKAIAGHEGIEISDVIGRRWACDRSGDLAVTQVLIDHLKAPSDAVAPFDADELAAFLSDGASESTFEGRRLPAHWPIAPGETVMLTNNRADRTCQVAQLLGETQPLLALVELAKWVPVERVFFPIRPRDVGVESVLQERGVSALRVAEQCKFPHVTTFFDGFREDLGADAVCIPSIAEEQYAEQPEMSAEEVADVCVDAIAKQSHRAVVANLASLDQIGHTANPELAQRAAAAIDAQIERLKLACSEAGWNLLITADHGNAETLLDDRGRPFGSHSECPVPLVVVPARGQTTWVGREGSLANVAATFLGSLGVSAPDEMAPSLVDWN